MAHAHAEEAGIDLEELRAVARERSLSMSQPPALVPREHSIATSLHPPGPVAREHVAQMDDYKRERMASMKEMSMSTSPIENLGPSEMDIYINSLSQPAKILMHRMLASWRNLTGIASSFFHLLKELHQKTNNFFWFILVL